MGWRPSDRCSNSEYRKRRRHEFLRIVAVSSWWSILFFRSLQPARDVMVARDPVPFAEESAATAHTYTGAGGTGGSNKQGADSSDAGGFGQSSANYTSCLQLAIYHTLTSGTSGAGSLTYRKSNNYWGALGGVLLDGNGPVAQDGKLLLLI